MSVNECLEAFMLGQRLRAGLMGLGQRWETLWEGTVTTYSLPEGGAFDTTNYKAYATLASFDYFELAKNRLIRLTINDSVTTHSCWGDGKVGNPWLYDDSKNFDDTGFDYAISEKYFSTRTRDSETYSIKIECKATNAYSYSGTILPKRPQYDLDTYDSVFIVNAGNGVFELYLYEGGIYYYSNDDKLTFGGILSKYLKYSFVENSSTDWEYVEEQKPGSGYEICPISDIVWCSHDIIDLDNDREVVRTFEYPTPIYR